MRSQDIVNKDNGYKIMTIMVQHQFFHNCEFSHASVKMVHNKVLLTDQINIEKKADKSINLSKSIEIDAFMFLSKIAIKHYDKKLIKYLKAIQNFLMDDLHVFSEPNFYRWIEFLWKQNRIVYQGVLIYSSIPSI